MSRVSQQIALSTGGEETEVHALFVIIQKQFSFALMNCALIIAQRSVAVSHTML